MAFNKNCLNCLYCTCFGSNTVEYKRILSDPKADKETKNRIISEEFFCDYLCKTGEMRPNFNPEKESCPVFKKNNKKERTKMNREYYIGTCRGAKGDWFDCE